MYLHVKMGGVSNDIVDALCRCSKIMSGYKEEEAAKKGHYVGTVGGTRCQRVNIDPAGNVPLIPRLIYHILCVCT